MRKRTSVFNLEDRVKFLKSGHHREVATNLDNLGHRKLFAHEGKRVFVNTSLGTKRVPIRQFQESLLAIRKRIRIPVMINVIQLRFGNVVSSGPDDIRHLSIVTAVQPR